MAIKDSKYVKNYSVNPLYLIFSNANGYFEEINKSKYLTLVPTNESKEKIKKCEELILTNKYYPQVFLDVCLYKIYKWRVKMN